jgi:hypothetical protein
MLGDPSISTEKLPRLNSMAMRWVVEGLSIAADEAREDGKHELADDILAATERIDPGAAAWWREVGQAERKAYQGHMAARNAPPAPLRKRSVYSHGLEFFAIDSHGEEIVRLRANAERGLNKHERRAIADAMWDILRFLDLEATLDEAKPAEDLDVDEDGDDAGEEWKR